MSLHEKSHSFEDHKASKKISRYLNTVLKLSPIKDANLMIDLRWRFCNFHTESPHANLSPENLTVIRSFAETKIDEIRSMFWKADEQKLTQALASLKIENFPDLKFAVKRLRHLLVLRHEIQSLGKNSNCDIHLYNTFRRIVMLPPQQAAVIKEKYLRDFAWDDNRQQVLKMIEVLKSSFPSLYQIESVWFEQIARIRKRGGSDTSKEGNNFQFEVPSWMILVSLFIMLRIFFAFVRAFN